MSSRRLLRPNVLLLVSLAIVAGAFAQTTLAAQAGGQGYCLSELSDTVVYTTAIFDTKLNPKVPIATHSIARELHEYLKGRYGYKSRRDYPVVCVVLPSVAEAEAQKGRALGLVPSASKQVEVDWKYLPDSAWVAASFVFQRGQGGDASAPPRQPADHGYCFSQPAEGALHVSAVFDGRPGMNIALWQIAYSKYLGPKNGFIGNVSCSSGSLKEAQRMVKARTDGVRAANRQVVETGWKYDEAASSVPSAKPDEDREPAAPPPPPPPPSAQARDFATKEMPEVMAMCNNDKLISGAFDCNMVSRVVYNYRLGHWSAGATPEPLAQLFAGDKLDCTTCVKQFASMWAASRAQSQGIQLAPAQCVGERFVEGLKTKPYLNRVKELFDAAVAACKK
jgi:hypothetical protein